MASLHGWFSPRIVVQAPIMREGLFITVAPTVSRLDPSYTIQHMEGETNVTTGAATYVALCPHYDRMLRHSMRDEMNEFNPNMYAICAIFVYSPP